jgi:hypothetical protein
MLTCGWHEEGAIKVVAELISDSNKAYKSLTLVTEDRYGKSNDTIA